MDSNTKSILESIKSSNYIRRINLLEQDLKEILDYNNANGVSGNYGLDLEHSEDLKFVSSDILSSLSSIRENITLLPKDMDGIYEIILNPLTLNDLKQKYSTRIYFDIKTREFYDYDAMRNLILERIAEENSLEYYTKLENKIFAAETMIKYPDSFEFSISEDEFFKINTDVFTFLLDPRTILFKLSSGMNVYVVDNFESLEKVTNDVNLFNEEYFLYDITSKKIYKPEDLEEVFKQRKEQYIIDEIEMANDLASQNESYEIKLESLSDIEKIVDKLDNSTLSYVVLSEHADYKIFIPTTLEELETIKKLYSSDDKILFYTKKIG